MSEAYLDVLLGYIITLILPFCLDPSCKRIIWKPHPHVVKEKVDMFSTDKPVYLTPCLGAFALMKGQALLVELLMTAFQLHCYIKKS